MGLLLEIVLLKKIIKAKMRSLGCVLTRADWCPYEKRGLGHGQAWREDHVKTLEEDGHLQRGNLGRSHPAIPCSWTSSLKC